MYYPYGKHPYDATENCAKMPLCEDADAVLAKLTEIGIEYDVVEHNVADTVEVSAAAVAVAVPDKLGAGVVGCAVCQWRQCRSSDRRVLQKHVSRTQEETRNDVPGCLPGWSGHEGFHIICPIGGPIRCACAQAMKLENLLAKHLGAGSGNLRFMMDPDVL